MPPDKYTAVWVSHTSIGDWLSCPRSYYLKHVYRDPKTNHKIKLMTPPLALGSSVHEVIESLSVLPKEKRFTEPLPARFERVWKKFQGKQGGFFDEDTEYRYKVRGAEMLRRVQNHPGPLARPAVKIQKDLPYFWLSDDDNIILCGKLDWLEYLPDTDSINIIDFKTGKNDENEKSLQLPIYHLLVRHCQKREVTKASYWYLDRSDELTEQPVPDLSEAQARVLAIARDMKLARQLERFKCPEGADGCRDCRPMEAIFRRSAEFVGNDEYNYDVYVLPRVVANMENDSVIL